MNRRKFLGLLGLAPFVAKLGFLVKSEPVVGAVLSDATITRSWTGASMLTPGQIVADINSMAEHVKESTGITPSRIIMTDENYKLLSESDWEGSSTSIMEYITKG